ncbi:MAG TPA: PQQ-dependent sugar dehydrogenase [Gaiellaceae bacterium]|nr:PQQ-dependent sugar dehydrogenase [Gaiellaceae bacterium]
MAVALTLLGAFVLLAGARVPGAATSGSLPPARPLLGNPSAAAASAPASSVPVGFQDSVAFSGLTNPTAVRFAPDGRVFVIEKRGRLKVFDSLTDTTSTVVADLSSEVDDYWDRGLLGMALDPSFATTRPYVYLLYTYDAPPGQTAPVWNDTCPTPPGANTDGCVVSGRLVRVQVSAADQEVGSPQVLLANQWCQQYPSHSVGDLGFGPDGKLYVSAGEGASFTVVDYGQNGGTLARTQTPANPCGDPPAGVGVALTPPSAEGGALRAQSPNRAHGPAVLNGSVLRLDPDTGAGGAGNPWAGSSDANLRRITAYGLRNPFRFAFRPGTSDLWLGDVGWNDWEEIERLQTPPATAPNFGWPCNEGPSPQPGYQTAGLTMCSNLYATPGAATGPYFVYSHQDEVALGDGCTSTHGSVVSGIGFYGGTRYPAPYRGALVFADHSRECIWAMPLGANGQPDPSRVQPLVNDASNPVDIEAGPNGDLYYVDFDGGTIHHLSYNAAGTCATGTFLAEYHNSVDLSGPAVLRRCENAIDHDWANGPPGPGVNSDGFSATWSGQFSFAGGSYTFSSTADDGVRVFVDGVSLIDDWHDQSPTTTTATVSLTAGTHSVRVDYYDRTGGALARVSWELDAANSAPTAVIDAPSSTLTYSVGDAISFSGHATDPQDGALPASALSWTLLIHHCTTPTSCHVHDVQTWSGVSSGSVNAPDHDYPSHLELVLQATDGDGLQSSASVTLQPKTVDLSFATIPSGLALAVGSSTDATPFTRTVIAGSANSVSAPATQTLNGHTYSFASWSDGGAAAHTVTAPANAAGYTATYTDATPPPPPPPPPPFLPPVLPPLSTQAPTLSGTAAEGRLLTAHTGSWSGGTPIGFSFQWLRCNRHASRCSVVEGATGRTFRLGGAEVGGRVEARVTATNSVGSATTPTGASAVVVRYHHPPVRNLHRAPFSLRRLLR